jgi:hypothetical protein
LPGREDSIKEGVRDLKKTRVGQTDDSGDEEGLGEPEQESKEAKQVRLQKEREAKKMERLNAKLEKVNERRIKAEESRKRKLDAGADPALIKKQDRWVLEHGVSGAPQAHLQRNLRAPSSEQVQGSSGEVVDQSFCHLVFLRVLRHRASPGGGQGPRVEGQQGAQAVLDHPAQHSWSQGGP